MSGNNIARLYALRRLQARICSLLLPASRAAVIPWLVAASLVLQGRCPHTSLLRLHIAFAATCQPSVSLLLIKIHVTAFRARSDHPGESPLRKTLIQSHLQRLFLFFCHVR